MEKIIEELINHSIKGVDVYRWRGATWLIFTDETRWVVELTDEGTLWYNYRFFNEVFRYVSMDLGQQTEKYIIEWANGFFYKDCAHRASAYPRDKDRTKTSNVLEHGIKNVSKSSRTLGSYVGKVVNHGIKEVNQSDSIHRQMRAENVMNQIIKKIKPNRVTVHDEKMDRFYYDPSCRANNTEIFSIVEEGVKNIYPDKSPDDYDWSDEFKADNVIQGGIKVIPLPDMSGELRGYSDYYNTKEDKTKPHTEYVKDAIEGGTKL